MKSLKDKIRAGQLTLGSWLTLGGEAAVAEIMLDAGFEWLVIDLEHSGITLSEAQNLLRVIQGRGRPGLVRLTVNDPNLIKRVMDIGADGIIVPMVNSADQARAAVEAMHYPPRGKRGVGLARAQKHGPGFESYKQWLKTEPILIVQIEHVEAVGNLEEILSVDGVDGSLIGPYDLSASLGVAGELDHPDVLAAMERYRTVCRKQKSPAGLHVVPCDSNRLEEKIREGYTFLAFSLDALFLATKVREVLSSVGKGLNA